MTEDFAFMDEVADDGLHSQRADALEIGFDGRLAFAGVLLARGGQDGRGVDDGVSKSLRRRPSGVRA